MLLGLIISGIFAVGVAFWARNLPQPTRPAPFKMNRQSPGYSQALEDWRYGNRNFYATWFYQGFFYTITFLLVFAALLLPVAVASHGFDEALDLSTTHIPLDKVLDIETLKTFVCLLALVLHMLLWMVVPPALDMVEKWIHPIAGITSRTYSLVATASVGIGAIFIGGNMFHLMDAKAVYLSSIIMPFVFILFCLGAIHSFLRR